MRKLKLQAALDPGTQLPAPTHGSLLDRAQARWAEIDLSLPDLAPAIALQKSLVGRTILAVDRLDHSGPPIVNLAPDQAADKLRAGTPVLRGERVALPVALLEPLLLDACDDLAVGGAGDVARRVRGCLDDGRINVNSLLTASFERNQSAILGKAVHEGIAPDVLWLAAELAVGPAAYVAQRGLLSPDGAESHSSVIDALEAWPHGYCPACGSWPAFGEDPDTSRQLRCSFCGGGWRPRTLGCTYCEDEPGHVTSLKTDPGLTHRATLCSGCGAYLKWLDLAGPTPFELLPIEDLASTPLDVLAVNEGFGRPSLPDLGRPERFPCQMVDPRH
ncbi:MAG: hypothetical protein CL477_09965 [Acidobacteria bacterium]|jgi:hypothetical protein|nr:hypothetical protein [Acidobacteriota bacterium]MDP7480362.1 formate dehydrogenase accessory protein FdhE [Vicinamibacterales bacterium]MDP7692949.1 formate dehydrogenase accessory protein FdhE [Vicinamibacterales bacterium]HJN43738.1 formate dehydrogenase accessory protein FdhE [Vicinamibacterales bacterium]|tara:strand:+ start:106 stop:1101 length:996 start_codon:yes stop_codon:yes gene_type:complete